MATLRKAEGSSPDEVIGFFQFTYSSRLHYGLGFYSATNRNDYKEFSWRVKRGRRLRLESRQPSVNRLSTKLGILDLSLHYDSPRRMTLVRTDVSVDTSASNIRVRVIGDLGTTLAVTSNRSTLRMNSMHC
jgi:hypothetical protein